MRMSSYSFFLSKCSLLVRYEDVIMMEAVRTSETSVYLNKTAWCYIPEGCIFILVHYVAWLVLFRLDLKIKGISSLTLT
jgi:hypothetical protein